MTTAQHLGLALEAAVKEIFGTKVMDVAILRPKERDGQISKSAGDHKRDRRRVKAVRGAK